MENLKINGQILHSAFSLTEDQDHALKSLIDFLNSHSLQSFITVDFLVVDVIGLILGYFWYQTFF